MKFVCAILSVVGFFFCGRAEACDVACGSFAQVQQFAHVQSFATVVQPVQAFAVVSHPVAVQQAVVANVGHCGVAVRNFHPVRAAVKVAVAPVRVLGAQRSRQVIRQRSVIINR